MCTTSCVAAVNYSHHASDILVDFVCKHTTLSKRDISSELILAILSKVGDKKQRQITHRGHRVPPFVPRTQISTLVQLLPPSSSSLLILRESTETGGGFDEGERGRLTLPLKVRIPCTGGERGGFV